MAAASEDKNLPYIRGVRLGALFNSRTGKVVPPTKTPSCSGRKLKEPRTWKRWTVVRSGPDLYRALQVPYPLALKVLAGQAPELDVPLVEWRQALSSPNCRAVLLQAGTELRERTVVESAYTPVENPHSGTSHFVHRVVTGRQLFILVILTGEEKPDIDYIDDDILEELTECHDDFDGAKSVFRRLDKKMKRSKGVQASVSVRPMNSKEEIKSLEEAVKLLSDFLSQPESVAEPCSKFADDDSSSDDEDASDNSTPVIKCFLRPCRGEASSEDLPAIPPLEKRTGEAKENFDRLYQNCLRAKELLDKLPNAQYRDYQRRELEKKRNAIAQRKGEFEEVIETMSVFEKLMSREEEELVNKIKGDLEADTQAFLEMLEYKLPPSTGPLNLLLLGKTGHGKSSTGNTILQLPGAFETSGGTTGTTTQCKVRMAEVDDQVIKVVDTPGIFDPSNTEESFAEICTAIALCTEGFDAVLIVWKYGTKLTPEEVTSIECLKRIFGQDLLEKHGVFLVTSGDQFELSRQNGEHSHRSFQSWMKEQMEKDANFKRFVSEFQGRYVLFNNRTEEEREKQGQLLDFVETVHGMKSQGNTRLAGELFQQAKKNLENEIQATQETVQIQEKDEKLANKIDDIVKAAAKLSQKEQREVENKVRYIQGFRLHFAASVSNACLDKALKDADDLETNVKYKTIKRRSGRFEWLWQSLSKSELSSKLDDFKTQADKLRLEADEMYRKHEDMAAAAGKKTAKESRESCFPGNATVRLQDGREVKMTSLQEGDLVLCGREDGSLTYSAVYMFGHKDENSSFYGLALSTRLATLRVSHDHLVFRRHFGNCAAVPARHVQVGDAIAVYRPGAATLQWEPVTHIQSQWETGVMAPFTLEGTMVVDDVLASCYVAVTSHKLCHFLLWPMRKLAVLAPRLSARLHRPGEGGLPPWVRLCLHHLLPWLPRHRLLSA